jgi:hypothetical protein
MPCSLPHCEPTLRAHMGDMGSTDPMWVHGFPYEEAGFTMLPPTMRAHNARPHCGVEAAVVHNGMLPPTLRAHIPCSYHPYGVH